MKPIVLKPSNGGRLMSNPSAAGVGLSNYTTKRDWRRLLDREIRAEGHVKFAPNPNKSEISQSLPTGVAGAIIVIAETTLPNGRIATVVGTRTNLWVYYGLYNGIYVDGDANGLYVVSDYFEDNPGVWEEIGSGFSTNGNRWEAEQVGEYLVLNNGVDLPMTYRAGDSSVTPIWELREQGVASVGTIAEINGILCCFDIRAIPTGNLETIAGAKSGAVEGAVSGAVSSIDSYESPIFGSGTAIFGGGTAIFGN